MMSYNRWSTFALMGALTLACLTQACATKETSEVKTEAKTEACTEAADDFTADTSHRFADTPAATSTMAGPAASTATKSVALADAGARAN